MCKDCYTQFPADTDNAKHEDRKYMAKKVAAGVGGEALAVGGVMFKYEKNAFDVMKNSRVDMFP